MELTENFSVEELTTTETGQYNTPGEVELSKLLYLATYILQPIRERWGRLKINSGFRSKAVQDALTVSGAPTSKTVSQHTLGEAADFVPLDSDIDSVFLWCKDMLNYGQIILEESRGAQWIHISLPRIAKQNQMAMKFDGNIYHNV